MRLFCLTVFNASHLLRTMSNITRILRYSALVAAFIKPIVALFLIAGIDIVCLIILGTQHS